MSWRRAAPRRGGSLFCLPFLCPARPALCTACDRSCSVHSLRPLLQATRPPSLAAPLFTAPLPYTGHAGRRRRRRLRRLRLWRRGVRPRRRPGRGRPLWLRAGLWRGRWVSACGWVAGEASGRACVSAAGAAGPPRLLGSAHSPPLLPNLTPAHPQAWAPTQRTRTVPAAAARAAAPPPSGAAPPTRCGARSRRPAGPRRIWTSRPSGEGEQSL